MADLFDKTTRALGASVNLRQLKNNVISSNIANAETPGYQAKKLDFEDALSRALDVENLNAPNGTVGEHFSTGPGAISRVKADIYENPDVSVNNDGNTVDVEREMTNLAENSIMYKAAIQLINKKMAALKYAASDGGR
ncbi:MAG TPA: flagellar basal body rod protein FlgB [Bdellovibrionales bacterium]|nr:flagellar basal body rod protein FlgB [Bdellovibrionales bacterium]